MRLRLPKGVLRETLAMAVDSVRSHKFRSFLTVLGIVIGVLTAICIASLLTGLRQNIVAMIEEYGTNNIYAFHLSTGPRTSEDRSERLRKPLTVADAETIKAQASAVEDVCSHCSKRGLRRRALRRQHHLPGTNYRWGNTQGVSANYADITNIVLKEGRFISELDDQQRANVMVIGVNAADALSRKNDISGFLGGMGGYNFEIVGVLEKRKAGFFGENKKTTRSISLSGRLRKSRQQRDTCSWSFGVDQVKVSEALSQAEEILRRRRAVKFSDPNNFDIKTADKFIEQFDSITAMVGLIAIAISSLGLLVGGIGVMNIMLVSVTERTKRLVRKAIGARRRDIVRQFLFEAMMLTFLGGVLGVLLAVAVSRILMFFISALPHQFQPGQLSLV